MIMLPPICPSNCSEGEKLLFEAFRKEMTYKDWYCMHSYRVKEHQYKSETEIDFLLLGPPGIICLEVKHTNVSFDGTYWDYDYDKKKESPFEQVSTAMWALNKILNFEYQIPFLKEGILGYGVAFTYKDFTTHSPEWNQNIILNRSDIFTTHDISQKKKYFVKYYIKLLVDTWQKKQPRKPGFTSAQLKYLRDILRPNVPKVRSIQPEIYSAEQQMVELTNNQQEAFDRINSNQQIICKGGAGTGKTMIALANAHLNAENNQKVLFLCFNPVLAMYIQKQLIKTDNITVVSILSHFYRALRTKRLYKEFPNHKDIGTSKYIDDLPSDFLEDMSSGHQVDTYDVLIIDEAQDCLNLPYLESIAYFLKGGWDNGCWRIFMDPDNQSGFTGAFDPDALAYLESEKPAYYELDENCRNTKYIAKATQKVTGINFYKKANIDGRIDDAVPIFFKGCFEHSLISYINTLIQEGCHPSEITVLSGCSDLRLSILTRIKSKLPGKPEFLNSTTHPTFPFSSLTCSTVDHFKGLENRIVLLIEMDDASSKTFYLSMTRARVHLRFFIPEEKRDLFNFSLT